MSEPVEEFEDNYKEDTIQDFCELIATVMDYFDAQYDDEDTEDWKKQTIKSKGRKDSIPEEIDELIIEAFKSQISKFIIE